MPTYLRRAPQHGNGEAGASAVEYSLLVVGIAAVIVLVVVAIGGLTNGNYQQTCDKIAATNAPNLSSATC